MAESDTGDDIIEFVNPVPDTDPAEPKPAYKYVPDWYEDLDYEKDTGQFNRTVKSCIPFMEAMTVGWIVPIPHDITLRFGEDGRSIEIQENPELLSPHEMDQMGGEDHPLLPAGMIKFRTPWIPRTPEGYSTFFMPPLNRTETRWRSFAGIVDTDEYITNVNAPSIWLQPGYEGTIEKGTPLLQAIPFKRDAIGLDGRKRAASKRERKRFAEREHVDATTSGGYKEDFWVPKRKDREVPE